MLLCVGFPIKSWSVEPYTCTATLLMILPDAVELTLHLLVLTQIIRAKKVTSHYYLSCYTPPLISLLQR